MSEKIKRSVGKLIEFKLTEVRDIHIITFRTTLLLAIVGILFSVFLFLSR